MVKKVKKQLTPGRPRTAVDKAELPSSPLKPKQPKVPKLSVGELPKELVGAHMGSVFPKLGRPKVLAPRAITSPPPISKG